MAKALGIAHEFLTPDEVVRLYPLVSLKGVAGALYTLDDGHVDPATATQSFAIGACQGGAEINRDTKVVDLAQRPGGEWGVEIDKGTIAAGGVVNATGLRGDEIAALAGTFLPLVAIQLQHLVTEAIPEIADLETEFPVLGGLDGPFYLRQERDGILIGVYEEEPVFWAIDGIPPPNFGQDTLPANLERVGRSVGAALARVLVLAQVGIKTTNHLWPHGMHPRHRRPDGAGARADQLLFPIPASRRASPTVPRPAS